MRVLPHPLCWLRWIRRCKREMFRLLEAQYGPEWGDHWLKMSKAERRTWMRRAAAGMR